MSGRKGKGKEKIKVTRGIKGQRIAIVNLEKCKPNKCKKECITFCPVELQNIECITIVEDIEDIGAKRKYAKISEQTCTGCGICVKKCPFEAIKIVNVPSEVGNFISHRFGVNGFRLYRMPVMKPFQVIGLLGQNGIGKSTVMQILAGKLKPNFENFEDVLSDVEIIGKFKGSELHKYMERLYKGELKVVMKPQHIDGVVKSLKVRKLNPSVWAYLVGESEYGMDDVFFGRVVDMLGLGGLAELKMVTLSGGELQRVVCAGVILKKADVFIFDEATNFLDVRQRLRIAELIRSLSGPNIYVVVIEHDLTVLDYMSDYVCIMYGKPGAYGCVAMPYSTADAINIYFDGYIPAENMRFRGEEYSIKDLGKIESDVEADVTNVSASYDEGLIEFAGFKLEVMAGKFPASSSIVLVLAENGMGKTTFLNYLAEELGLSVSYKQQIFDITPFLGGDGEYPTVEQLFYDRIKASYVSELFISDVVRPLNITDIKTRKLNELSGGELQKILIILCLGAAADVYLIDEPSACLDIEQRVLVTKILKRFIVHNKKIAFIVEHDIMVAISLGQEVNSRVVVLERVGVDGEIRVNRVNPPMNAADGINIFLKSLNVTFRTDAKYAKHARPRINKPDSVRDREQKAEGKYYRV
ncbi:MAG: putative ABC transporter E family member 1-like [Hyperionvirus sp.]|uniref:Putative ABC transporter E family member 1-like n=1 Tax=Hyperionvirus sp. TaxID=2487770 RepID=A0A3G5ADA7_9VIRU|nr:MAG: putative ABC transporter E family member 1-like [Hyperionvirus sp.]